MSGILLGKTMGRGSELADRFESDRAPGESGGAPAHGRALGDGVDPDQLRGDAGRGLLVRRARAGGRIDAVSLSLLVAFTTLQTRLFFPVGSLLGVSLDVQTSLALFDRIFEYLDQPIDIVEKPDAKLVAGRDVAFEDVWFRYGDEWTPRTCRSRSRRARRRRWWARRARARRTVDIWPRGSATSPAGE